MQTITDTSRYGRAHAQAWDRLHPRLEHRGAWTDHPGDLPIVEGTLIRLQVEHLPGQQDPSRCGCGGLRSTPPRPMLIADAGVPAPLRPRKHRLTKQTLGWTAPKICEPTAGDRWTWLIIVALSSTAAGPHPHRGSAPPLKATRPTRAADPGPGPQRFRHPRAKTRNRPTRRNPPTPVPAARPAPRTPASTRTTPSGNPNQTQQSRSPRSAKAKRQAKVQGENRMTVSCHDDRRFGDRRGTKLA